MDVKAGSDAFGAAGLEREGEAMGWCTILPLLRVGPARGGVTGALALSRAGDAAAPVRALLPNMPWSENRGRYAHCSCGRHQALAVRWCSSPAQAGAGHTLRAWSAKQLDSNQLCPPPAHAQSTTKHTSIVSCAHGAEGRRRGRRIAPGCASTRLPTAHGQVPANPRRLHPALPSGRDRPTAAGRRGPNRACASGVGSTPRPRSGTLLCHGHGRAR